MYVPKRGEIQELKEILAGNKLDPKREAVRKVFFAFQLSHHFFS